MDFEAVLNVRQTRHWHYLSIPVGGWQENSRKGGKSKEFSTRDLFILFFWAFPSPPLLDTDLINSHYVMLELFNAEIFLAHACT